MKDKTKLVRATFRAQSEACAALGSPFTAYLCEQFAEQLSDKTEIGALCLNWAGDPSISADSLPLRLCGGFHALVLSGQDEALAQAYQFPQTSRPDWVLMERVLIDHHAFLRQWLKSPPQTNEVSRSAVLWPGFMALAARVQRPLALLEIGASGGLNLQADRFSYDFGGVICGAADSAVSIKPDWQGDLPVVHDVEIASRAGCDIAPIDPTDESHALRLRAYCWADQTERRNRLDAALLLAQQNPVTVVKQDALAFLKDQLEARDPDICTVIYSTIAWQYLPLEDQAAGEALIKQYGAAAQPHRMAWLKFENDGQGNGAPIALTLNPGHRDEEHGVLGRAHFHGAWVKWNATH